MMKKIVVVFFILIIGLTFANEYDLDTFEEYNPGTVGEDQGITRIDTKTGEVIEETKTVCYEVEDTLILKQENV